MKVASLIKCLQEMDQDSEVYLTDYDTKNCLFAKLAKVEYDDDGDVVLVAQL